MPVLPSVMTTQIVTGDRNVVTKDVDSNVLILSVCVYSLFIYNSKPVKLCMGESLQEYF